MTDVHPLFREGYLYRYEQGQLPAQKQVPPSDISRDDLRHWAQGWQAADDDRTVGRPARWQREMPAPEVSGVVPVAPPEVENVTPADDTWMRVVIRRAGKGYVVDLNGKVMAVNEENREKNAAKMLGAIIAEIGKRMAREETEARLAEIHEKTKGAP